MKKLIAILLLFISFSASSQIVNKFRDSTWFAKGVRFDSAIYLIKGASNGKVLTSDASGRATWQTFSSSGVSQGALNDSINAVRSIRKVDTLYRNLDSLVFKINGIRYAIKDSSGGGVTQQALDDSIARLDSTIKNNSAIFPNGVKIISDTQYTLSSNDAGYYLVSISPNTHFIMPNTCPFSVGDVIGLYADLDTTTFDISSSVTGIELFTGQSSENGETFIMQCVDVGGGAEMLPLSAIKDDNGVLKTLNKYLYDQLNTIDQRISDTATQIRSEIPDVSNFATTSNLADTATLLRSLIPATATFTISKNSAKDSIVTVFNGTRSAVKDSVANLTNYVTNTTLTDSLAKKTNKLISFNAYTTSDTLRLTDADKVIEMNVGSANNLVIPTNTAYAFPVGTQIVLIQIGAGQTTFVPASGVTVSSAGGKLKLTGQYSGATIIKKGTNEWYLFGDITN